MEILASVKRGKRVPARLVNRTAQRIRKATKHSTDEGEIGEGCEELVIVDELHHTAPIGISL